MAVNVKALNQPYLYNYKYDQLNRLIAMDAYTGLNETNNTWAALTVTNKFKERVSYDANGNIKTYVRHHEFENAPMDDLTYYYTAGTNKLTHVKEGPNSQSWINGTKDIEDQSAGNYDYDEIGNLIKDASENIAPNGIQWNVYGKIQSITRSAATANNSTKQIRYDYDAAGNRIGKKVIKFGTARVEHTWYVRDATGNMLGVYTAGMDTTASTTLSNFALLHTESYLYGSSKLGVLNRMEDVEGTNYNGAMSTTWRGSKHFELSNHLGNVMAVISDKKLPIADPNNATLIAGYDAEVVSANDYYPFGMTSRSYNNGYGNYRAGFGGQEKSKEVGEDSYTAEFWQYDARLGRRWNIDPVYQHSPYSVFGNNPISFVDPDGADTININRTTTIRRLKGFNDGHSDNLVTPSRAHVTQSGNIVINEAKGNDVFRITNTVINIDENGNQTSSSNTTTLELNNPQTFYRSGGHSMKGFIDDRYALAAYAPDWLLNSYANKSGDKGVRSAIAYQKDMRALPYITATAAIAEIVFTGGISGFLSASSKGVAYTNVGRWMSQAELKAMNTTGVVQQGAGGQTFVTTGGATSYMGAARGSVYVEFQVPTKSLLQGGKDGWFKMIGPNASKTMQYQLKKQGGEMLPQIKNLTGILKTK